MLLQQQTEEWNSSSRST